ncbi:MAG: PQQ-like beta-propeller repeat protein [Anaerolineales bacterium]|nr:PQQ-like beta-propeller repeat protein [Anaerolineales bacterium]
MAALSASEWSQEAHDPQRTGYAPIQPKTPWTLLWTFNAADSSGGASCPGGDPTRGHCYNAAREAHTVTGAGAVYVPAGAQGLYALEALSGVVRWRVTGATFNATPAYAGGAVYAGTAEGQLYRVDVGSGQVTTYNAGSPINRALLIAGGAVFALTENGRLHKLDPNSLTPLWVYNANASTTEGTGLAYSESRDVVLFGTNDLYVHAVRNSDGTQKWRTKPSPNPAGFPNQFLHYWPVVAEQNGIVFIRMRLDHNTGLWNFPAVTTNAAARDHLVRNPAQQNLFALNLDDGSKKFIPAVGYGGTEDMVAGATTCAAAACPYLVTGPPPVVKLNADGTEVAYIHFRNNQGNTSDARWDSHMGEMVLNDSTFSGMVAGDLRFVQMGKPNATVTITDEQNPLTVAGNAIFHAHWAASEAVSIVDRSSNKGATNANPITTTALPTVLRRMNPCAALNTATHAANACGLYLFGDSRYWPAPGFWTYANTYDPPTPANATYSDGLRPRYTYVSGEIIVVEGNGGDLMIFRHSGP